MCARYAGTPESSKQEPGGGLNDGWVLVGRLVVAMRLVLNTATQQLRVCCVCVPARGKGMPTAAVAEHTRGGPRQHLIATAAVRIGTVAVAEAAGVAIAWRGAAAAAVA